MMIVRYRPIGIIHTPFRSLAGMPIQPMGAQGARGQVDIAPEFRAGLKDLSGFSHIILLYHFHKISEIALQVKPFLDLRKKGVFATRAPPRPNPIGMSVVRLIAVRGTTLTVEGVDMLDGTPLLDLKPFVPAFDAPTHVRIGWLTHKQAHARNIKADDRFSPKRRSPSEPEKAGDAEERQRRRGPRAFRAKKGTQ